LPLRLERAAARAGHGVRDDQEPGRVLADQVLHVRDLGLRVEVALGADELVLRSRERVEDAGGEILVVGVEAVQVQGDRLALADRRARRGAADATPPVRSPRAPGAEAREQRGGRGDAEARADEARPRELRQLLLAWVEVPAVDLDDFPGF